jgi:hypothetical protein
MKMKFPVLILMSAAMLASAAAHASTNVLPDACGDDKVKFDVQTQKGAAAPALPADGKAQIVFIETMNRPSAWSGTHVSDVMTRFGVDGTWAGATKSNSYFTVDVAPGEHHLCFSVRGSKDMVGATSITVEAGKIYYFEFKVEPTVTRTNMTMMGGTAPASGSGTSVALSSGFTKLDDDAGKFRVKASALSTSTAQK